MSASPYIPSPGTVVGAGALASPGGDQGLAGSQGPQGIQGPGAWTLTVTSSFTVPAVGATVVVQVSNAAWVTPGEVVWVANANGAGVAGAFRVQSVAGNSVTLLNIDTSSSGPSAYMQKSVYDTSNDGIVDHAALADTATLANTANAAPWTGITGKPVSFYPSGYMGSDNTNNNAYVITAWNDFQLAAGVVVWLNVLNANTGAPTLNVSGTGAKPIVNRANTTLSAGEITINKYHGLVYDGISWRVFTYLTKLYAVTNPANPTIECLGYDAIRIYGSFNAATGAGFSLTHVAEGTPIFIDIYNGTAAAMAYYVNVSNVAGATMPVYWIWSNATAGAAATRIDSTSIPSITSGYNVLLIGTVFSGQVFFL